MSVVYLPPNGYNFFPILIDLEKNGNVLFEMPRSWKDKQIRGESLEKTSEICIRRFYQIFKACPCPKWVLSHIHNICKEDSLQTNQPYQHKLNRAFNEIFFNNSESGSIYREYASFFRKNNLELSFYSIHNGFLSFKFYNASTQNKEIFILKSDHKFLLNQGTNIYIVCESVQLLLYKVILRANPGSEDASPKDTDHEEAEISERLKKLLHIVFDLKKTCDQSFHIPSFQVYANLKTEIESAQVKSEAIKEVQQKTMSKFAAAFFDFNEFSSTTLNRVITSYVMDIEKRIPSLRDLSIRTTLKHINRISDIRYLPFLPKGIQEDLFLRY